jgi:hypothetical protein
MKLSTGRCDDMLWPHLQELTPYKDESFMYVC